MSDGQNAHRKVGLYIKDRDSLVMSALGVSIHFFTAKVLLPISLGKKMFVEDFEK